MAFKRYMKGSKAENQLIALLENDGHVACRIAGSGVKGDVPDVLAFKDGKVSIFECKAWETGIFIMPDQYRDLMRFEEKGGIPVKVAWRRNRLGWRLFPLSQFKVTKKGYYRLNLIEWNSGIELDWCIREGII